MYMYQNSFQKSADSKKHQCGFGISSRHSACLQEKGKKFNLTTLSYNGISQLQLYKVFLVHNNLNLYLLIDRVHSKAQFYRAA